MKTPILVLSGVLLLAGSLVYFTRAAPPPPPPSVPVAPVAAAKPSSSGLGWTGSDALRAARAPASDPPAAETPAPIEPIPVDGPSFTEYLAEAQALSDAELSERLAKLNAQLRDGRYVERANAKELSPEELSHLAWLLRQSNALKSAQVERLLAADDTRSEAGR